MSSRISWKAVSTLAAFGLAAVLLYFSLRGIDWPVVWQMLLQANPGYLIASCGIAILALFLRAMRWRILLCAERLVTVRDAFSATCAGYFGNNFLPARAGELIRTYLIHASSGLSKTYVLTTALSERVVDAVTLVAISAVALLTLPEQPGWLAHASKPFATVGVCGILGFALAPRFAYVGDRWIDRFFPRAFRLGLHAILEQVIMGIRAFHNPRRLASFGGLTLAIWINDALGTIVIARAISLHIDVPVAFLLLAGLGLASALPSTPGYVGIYQFVAVSVLVPFGISRTQAIGFILLVQALQYLILGLLGAVGFWKFRALRSKAPEYLVYRNQ